MERRDAMAAAYCCDPGGGDSGALRGGLGHLQDARISAIEGYGEPVHYDSAQGQQVRVRLSGVNRRGLLHFALFAGWGESLLAVAPPADAKHDDVMSQPFPVSLGAEAPSIWERLMYGLKPVPFDMLTQVRDVGHVLCGSVLRTIEKPLAGTGNECIAARRTKTAPSTRAAFIAS